MQATLYNNCLSFYIKVHISHKKKNNIKQFTNISLIICLTCVFRVCI